MTTKIDEAMVSKEAIANLSLLANVSGGSAPASAQTLSAILDAILGSTRGAILTRGASGWTTLPAGAASRVLTSAGAAQDPVWQAIPGGGDVVAANQGTEFNAVSFASNLGLVRRQTRQLISANTTLTALPGCVFAVVEVIGGGGGGGGVGGNTGFAVGGGGGSSGAYVIKVLTAAQIGAGLAVTIGTGGAGGVGFANGSAGNSTTVGSVVTAVGGLGGSGASAFSAIPGGAGANAVGTNGDILIQGRPGEHGYLIQTNTSLLPGGSGGDSHYGSGGKGGFGGWTAGSVGGTGIYGSGGGGAYAMAVATNHNGGAGGSGIVLVTQFCTQ